MNRPFPPSRRPARILLPCLGVCAVLSMAACGGKGRTSSAPKPTSTLNPEGSWSGTFKTATGSTAVSALVQGDGALNVFDAKGESVLFGEIVQWKARAPCSARAAGRPSPSWSRTTIRPPAW